MFLMSYFRTEAEALHYALSPDGNNWRALNGNRPVYESTVGTNSIRDPFILPDRAGRFHLLSTNGWNSYTIFHAVSDDLITWRDAKLLPLMEQIEGTKNAWAPEAFWEAELGQYRVIWSSTTPLTGEAMDVHGYNHRIWSATTRDFEKFGPPDVFLDPGYNLIDAAIIARPEGGYLMAFKDERDALPGQAHYKAIRVATARYATGPWGIREEFVTPPLTEGPILFLAEGRDGQPEWRLFFDHFTDGHFGAASSPDGLHWTDITSEVYFPEGPRHACVIEIAEEVAECLIKAFG